MMVVKKGHEQRAPSFGAPWSRVSSETGKINLKISLADFVYFNPEPSSNRSFNILEERSWESNIFLVNGCHTAFTNDTWNSTKQLVSNSR